MDAPASDAIFVTKVVTSGPRRKLFLSTGEILELHRFAPIGLGDKIRTAGSSTSRRVTVPCLNGDAQIVPSFATSTHVPGLSQSVHVKEVETADELAAYERLGGYHYRNNAGFGRKSILVATIGVGRDAKTVGYVEITNTFSGHQARNALLDAPFQSGPISWSRWDLEAKRKFLNSIARISRCVVHPEYRGIGLGVILCRAAIKFCQSAWQVAGLRPVFLEITADMLKFVPFAERAGMKYIGSTSGNIKRLIKDQTYLKGVREDIASGSRNKESHSVFKVDARSILKRQRRDTENMEKMGTEHGVEMLQLLRTYLDVGSPEELPSSAYELLHQFIRFPKPTYMIGLTREADAFLSRRLAELSKVDGGVAPDFAVPALVGPIVVDDLTITHEIEIPSAPWANAIQEAFGVHRKSLSVTGIRGLSIEIEPREIVYVWGASGSGKTLLLDSIRGIVKPTSGQLTVPAAKSIAILDFEFGNRPVLEEVSDGVDLKNAIYALNLVGLSEASIYFKNPAHLSNGQRYRLGIAKLMLSRRPLWIVDEFCSVLDDNTAELTSWNLARFARRFGATAIIAGPRREPVISALSPDKILSLDTLGEWRIDLGTPK